LVFGVRGWEFWELGVGFLRLGIGEGEYFSLGLLGFSRIWEGSLDEGD